MKTSLLAGALALTLALPALAAEGTRGGGKGVVCRDPHGNVQSVELLDLWEAKALYNRPAKISTAPIATQVANALRDAGKAMDPMVNDPELPDQGSFAEMLQMNLRSITLLFLKKDASVHWLKGVSLTLTDDSYEIAKPENCEIEQIVDYNDGPGLVYVNEDLFQKMNTTNQAALFVHESIYHQLRNTSNDTDTLRTRRAVGYIFSGHNLPAPPVFSSYLECQSGELFQNETDIVIYPNADQKTFSVVTPWSMGQQVLGYFPALVKITGTQIGAPLTTDHVLETLSPSFCKPTDSGETATVWVASNSPITYENSASIVVTCLQGKSTLNYIPPVRPSGVTTIEAQPVLTCKWHDGTTAATPAQ